jgi:23S rRNA (adenine1618-N6)-methyltransferase
MHPRNRFKDRYDLVALTKALPELGKYVAVNKYGSETIDFSDPVAVKALNKALLKYTYGIHYWDIPVNFLCPPIPGRADYIHALSDLIGAKPDPLIKVLDIGTGANCIYPLIGHAEYKWSFVGSDVDQAAVMNAQKIVIENKLQNIEIRLQKEKKIFIGVILEGEKFTFSMCNPPFHASAEEASAGSERKWRNLGKKVKGLNFGGRSNELWTEGGEKAFVTEMIKESSLFKNQCLWFTTLVSKETNLPLFEKTLKAMMASEVSILPMEQGQKKSRVLAWTFQKA